MQWRLTGTFAGPGLVQRGRADRAIRIELEGVDVLHVRDGLIQSNDAFTDTMTLPRQIGMMPPLGSSAEQRLTGAFNAKTRISDGASARRGQAGRRRACGSCRASRGAATCI